MGIVLVKIKNKKQEASKPVHNSGDILFCVFFKVTESELKILRQVITLVL